MQNQKATLKLTVLSLLITILLSTNLYSQGGSNYSAIGYGDFNNFGNAYSAGINGLSMALPSKTSINMQNPAAWTSITSTRLNMGYWFNQNMVTTGENTLWQNNGAVSGFSGILSIDTARGLSIGFGIVPKSMVRYFIGNPVSIENDGITATGTTYYRGEGGLNEAFFGMSAKFFQKVSVGATINYAFGGITNTTQSTFENDYTLYSPKITSADFLSGISGTIGTMVNVGHGFNIGAACQLGTDLSYDNTLVYYGISSQTDTIISTENLSTTLPMSIGAGLSYTNKRFLVGFDFKRQDFSNTEYRTANNTTMRPLNQYTLGFSIDANPRPKKYIDLVTWRTGLSYRELYYTINNENINEFSLSFGASCPVGRSLMFDTGLVLGTRGTQNTGLVKENFARLFIEFSIGEQWFKRFERDYTIED